MTYAGHQSINRRRILITTHNLKFPDFPPGVLSVAEFTA
jgi:hypothetical protein